MITHSELCIDSGPLPSPHSQTGVGWRSYVWREDKWKID